MAFKTRRIGDGKYRVTNRAGEAVIIARNPSGTWGYWYEKENRPDNKSAPTLRRAKTEATIMLNTLALAGRGL